MGVVSKIPWWKRPFDVVFSLFAIILTLPIMLIIAIIIKFTDRGSILFVQERPGLNGKQFKLYKFRTMYPNNDKILQEFLAKNPEAAKEWRLYRKLRKYDPRVTSIGRFLRKTSLDELPQFFNILKGDMSVVGPRPYLLSEFEDYNIPENIRKKLLSVRPGITGLWQVEGRNEMTFQDRVNLDLEYIDNISFTNDIIIILKTIIVMFSGRGAY
ncbi:MULTISPECIES: sugar transferase [unclassified Desulfurobacterium]|uniref:sugar transferase n=1 Tax=Desulfurobacterium sp. TC5-1 TaxID=1158318 RepID=UPI0003B36E47|nr:sugar transferase [Desulfurobacterium sp. TC5-1]